MINVSVLNENEVPKFIDDDEIQKSIPILENVSETTKINIARSMFFSPEIELLGGNWQSSNASGGLKNTLFSNLMCVSKHVYMYRIRKRNLKQQLPF